MRKLKFTTTSRRLAPLYIASFLQSIPFWYATEKLFMTSIGFTTATIGLMVAVMSVVILAVETPSGVLADRWSRKGVMLLGCLALLVSGVLGGMSYTVPIYILSTTFWGIYAALYSGVYDSVIYDTTLEEQGSAKRYEYYLSRFRIVEGCAFVVGSLAGGLIATQLSMRETFFLAVPGILLAMLFLLRFREPTIHKAEVGEPVLKHIRQTFAVVLRNRYLLPVVIAVVGFAVLQDTLYELYQLWFIASNTPLALYGLIAAAVLSTWAIGGLIVNRTQGRFTSLGGLVVILLTLLGLIYLRNPWLLLAAQFLLGAYLTAYGVILSRKLHDELPSKVRAGSSSVVSTLGRAIMIPGSLLFTAIANQRGVFMASYLLLGMAVIAIIAYLFTLRAPRVATAVQA